MPKIRFETKSIVMIDSRNQETLLVQKLAIADSFWSRFWGLMGQQAIPNDAALWLRPCRDIHTFFMRFAIDVVYLDEDMKVVRVDRHVKPWRIKRPCRRATSVLELPGSSFPNEFQKDSILIFR